MGFMKVCSGAGGGQSYGIRIRIRISSESAGGDLGVGGELPGERRDVADRPDGGMPGAETESQWWCVPGE